MINLSIAFDDENKDAGDYFNLSKDDLIEFLANYSDKFSINLLNSSNCNENNIETEMKSVNSNNHLFVTYCHGNDDRMVAKDCSFIESDKNTHLFMNSLFYSVSCLCARGLGQDLINNGCHIFIGYSEIFRILPNNYQITIDCSNYAIKRFIEGKTIGEAFDLMIEYYKEQVDKLFDSGEDLKAFFLGRNVEFLKIMGNRHLTIEDFVL